MKPVETIANGIQLYPGECMAVLATLEPDSVDSCVTDPPYHLTSIVKRFGAENAAPAKSGKTGAYKRASAGFMGKQWDGGEIAFEPETWAAVYRVLKPGGHLLAFSGTRTYHRMAVAIDDAGFEVRDMISWLYGSGFPKSHDVSKGIDRAAGAERKVGQIDPARAGRLVNQRGNYETEAGWSAGGRTITIDPPATDEARAWQGFGTALKPACEPIVLARKPLIGTVAENVLKHGTGALNIDGCRVATDEGLSGGQYSGSERVDANCYGKHRNLPPDQFVQPQGRWPANVIHDGSDEVVGAFPESKDGVAVQRNRDGEVHNEIYGSYRKPPSDDVGYGSGGSAARFFYTAKADQDDRLGSFHPTVKPLDLMQWLVRLVTPKGGTVLDPFAGTGTTGEAAFREGMRAILIEREAEYQNDIRRRMKLVLGGPDERKRESIKARGQTQSAGPLFAEIWEEPFVDQS